MLASHVAEFDISAPAAHPAQQAPNRHYPALPMLPQYQPPHYPTLTGPSVKAEPMENRYMLNGPQGIPSYPMPQLPGPQIPGAPRPQGQPMMTYSGSPPTARTTYAPTPPAPSGAPQQRIPQVDGPSSSGSDSESPPSSGYAPHSQHPSLPQPQASSSNRPTDSEAINSDLDDSDSEEEEEAQDEGPGDGDIVFCTYDKACTTICLRQKLTQHRLLVSRTSGSAS